MDVSSVSKNGVGFKSLYMPSDLLIKRAVGKDGLKQIKQVMPKLKDMARDVDVYVSAVKDQNPVQCGFNFHIERLMALKDRFFRSTGISYIEGTSRKYSVTDTRNIADILVDSIRCAKSDFIASITPKSRINSDLMKGDAKWMQSLQ